MILRNGTVLGMLRHSSSWGLVCENVEAEILYGANTHIGLETGFSAYTDEAGVIDELASLGFTAFRDYVDWTSFEVSAGVYTFNASGDTQSQEFFQALARNASQGYKLTLDFQCAYDNGLYSALPNGPEWRGHFCDAYASVAQSYISAGYDPAKLIFEVWNEPTFFGTRFDTAAEAPDHANTVIAMRDRMYAIDPQIRVMGPAMIDASWSGNAAWLAGFWSTAGWSAAYAFSDHIYDNGSAAALRYPERFMSLLRKLYPGLDPQNNLSSWKAALAVEGKSTMPIGLTEFGWDTATFTDATAAKYYPRALAMFSALPEVRFLICYELINSQSATWGLETSLGVRKVQGDAVVALLPHLKAARSRHYYWTGGVSTSGFHAVLLKTDNGQRLVIWSMQGTQTVPLRVHSPGAGLLSVQIVGGAISTTALLQGENIVQIELTDTAKVIYSSLPLTFLDFA